MKWHMNNFICKKTNLNNANIEYLNKKKTKKNFRSSWKFMNVLGEYIILAKRGFTIS